MIISQLTTCQENSTVGMWWVLLLLGIYNMTVDSWQLTVDSWQLTVDSWQLTNPGRTVKRNNRKHLVARELFKSRNATDHNIGAAIEDGADVAGDGEELGRDKEGGEDGDGDWWRIHSWRLLYCHWPPHWRLPGGWHTGGSCPRPWTHWRGRGRGGGQGGRKVDLLDLASPANLI